MKFLDLLFSIFLMEFRDIRVQKIAKISLLPRLRENNDPMVLARGGS